MRTKDYRIYKKNYIKRRIIMRLRNKYRTWDIMSGDYDWNNITNHYHDTCVKFNRKNYPTEEAWIAKELIKHYSGHKPHYKAASWFKKHNERKRRAQIKDKMRHGDYENIPVFKKANDWDWD